MEWLLRGTRTLFALAVVLTMALAPMTAFSQGNVPQNAEFYSGGFDQNYDNDWFYDFYTTEDIGAGELGETEWWGDEFYSGSYDSNWGQGDWFYDTYEAPSGARLSIE